MAEMILRRNSRNLIDCIRERFLSRYKKQSLISIQNYIEIMATPYGIHTEAEWALIKEIDLRRSSSLSLDGLFWPESDDPLSPANNPKHPYYLPR